MVLKTDYKDDVFPGARLYRMIKNDDGTYSFVDATDYTQEGDLFGANDINSTNGAINALMGVKVVTVPAAGWSAAYPYSQSVSVSGITPEDAPTISCSLSAGSTAEQIKNQAKAFGCLYRAVSGDGNITFYAYKKPAVDFQATLKGV